MPPRLIQDSFCAFYPMGGAAGSGIARLIGYDGAMEDSAPSLPKKTGFRSLRIAWSVLAAAACICVLALWVRSFMFNEGWFVMRNGYWYKLWSIRGGLSVNFNVNNGPIPYFWRFYHEKIPDDYEDPPK